MPVAALADIHGNVQALDAVLSDPRCRAADRIVVLGDVVAGTFPVETFERLAALRDRVRILRGNADRIVLDQDGEESVWVREQLGPDRLAAVRAWPTEFAIEVEGLGTVRCCHAVPGADEPIISPATPDDVIEAALAGTDEPTVIGGHTHVRMDRRVGSRRFVNVGSVGRSREGVPGAYWGLLGPDVELVRTDYDVDAAARAVLASGQPTAEQVVDVVLRPMTPEDATAMLEEWRTARG